MVFLQAVEQHDQIFGNEKIDVQFWLDAGKTRERHGAESLHSRYLHLTVTGSLSKNSDAPAEFSACMRNMYSASSRNFLTLKIVESFTSPT